MSIDSAHRMQQYVLALERAYEESYMLQHELESLRTWTLILGYIAGIQLVFILWFVLSRV